MLWATKVAGRPNSYYREQDILYWADRWGIPHPEGADNAEFDRAYLAAMRREGEANTGVFGIRIMWSSIESAAKRLARAGGANIELAQLLNATFGRILYVHVTRENKIAQAVSRLRAEQSGVWHLSADGSILEGTDKPNAVSYDQHRLAQYVSDLHADDAEWDKFFEDNSIEPLRLTYEMTTSNPQNALVQVLSALKLDPVIASSIPVATAKMGDQKSQEWIERFRREKS
jgi:LPS sulfotransferase NodH